MPSTFLRRLTFALMYRFGFTPWDGHPIPSRVREAADATEKGRALDLGCGTGDTAIFFAKNGWEVVGVDFVQRALDRAAAKADAAGVRVRFVRGDVARLDELDVGDGFLLIVDGGLLHGLDDDVRAAYVGHLAGLASPGATLLIIAFATGGGRGPRGIGRDEVERRFGDDWDLVAADPDEAMSNHAPREVVIYELRRK